MNVLWAKLEASSDAEIAAIAGKAVKESRYHVAHAADWVVRLGDGTDESTKRMRQAVDRLWPYTAELFETDAVDTAAAESGLGPMRVSLKPEWDAIVAPVFAEAGLAVPATGAFRSTGSRGVHSEHMGYLLAEMQTLQRSFPGGAVVNAMTAHAAGVLAARRRTRGGCCTTCSIPEVPAISVTDLGIVRDVIDARRRARGGRDADVLRLPRDRGHRAGDLRRDRRRRPRARARDAAARARVDDRLDHAARPREAARLRHRAAGLVRERGRPARTSRRSA